MCVLVISQDVFIDGDSQNFVHRSEGIILLFFFIIFLVYNLILAKKGDGEELDIKDYSLTKSIIFVVIGLAGLAIGGRLIVDSAVGFAEHLGVSERIIALTIVSIGTSLPELATSLIAARKKNVDMAIGNVVGSNIFNIFLILGVSSTIKPVVVKSDAIIDIFVNILAGLLLFLFIFTGKGRKLERWEGIIFLLIYLSYMGYLIY
jgi:cation:H+ antiporter